MRIEDKKQSLEKYNLQPESADMDVRKAADLLYDILNTSYACSGNCLETEKNKELINISSIYWKTKSLLDKISENHEKIGFLAMSVLENAYRDAKPLLLCPAKDLLEGDNSILQNMRHLEAILSDNPYKQKWQEKEVLYKNILTQLGIDAESMDFSDLTEMTDPLLDALSFYENDRNKKSIRVVRGGEMSIRPKNPLIARDIRLYASEKDFTDTMKNDPNSNIIVFGAVEKTNAQTVHPFYEWYQGFPDEYTRNSMRYENLTKKQFMEQVNKHSRKIYLGVKSDEVCYLVPMPWRTQAPPDHEIHLYCYGKRVSYAPYQIFFKDHAKQRDETLPAVCKNRWYLSEVLDKPAMVWIVAFLDATIRYFSCPSAKEEPDATFFKEDGSILFPYQNGIKELPVAMSSGLPAKPRWEYMVREPEHYFEGDENTRELLRYFDIKEADITEAPLGPDKDGNLMEIYKETDQYVKKAYLKALSEKISGLIRTERKKTHAWMEHWILDNKGKIEENAASGKYKGFLECVMDKNPVYNPDGTPKMAKQESYPYEEIQQTENTHKEDAFPPQYARHANICAWYMGGPVVGKPPVVWKIRPSSTEDYETLAGLPREKLPELLRLCTPIRNFLKQYGNMLPCSHTTGNRYNNNSLDYAGPITNPPDFGRINICMRKATWKQVMKTKK